MRLFFQGDGTAPSAVTAKAVAVSHLLAMVASAWTGKHTLSRLMNNSHYLLFSRDEKPEWVFETKTGTKGDKIYSHTMCLPCHK